VDEADLAATLADWQAWLAQTRRASANTLAGYRRDLEGFLDYLAQRSGRPATLQALNELSPEDFRNFLDDGAASGRAPASLARAASSLRNFFGFLERAGLACNPAVQTLAAPPVPRRSARPLPTATAQQMVEVIPDLSDTPWIARRDELLFGLLYGSGLRLGEALALRRDQAPLGDNLTVIGRDGRRRTVPVLPFVPAATAEYLRTCPFRLAGDGPLFVGALGKPLNPGVVQRQLRRLRALLGLPETTTSQVFRDCFARRLQAEGGDLRAIQILLGHAHAVTTQRYADAEAVE
jgi:integrase/recombinase XerC